MLHHFLRTGLETAAYRGQVPHPGKHARMLAGGR